jgi:hypothetical protein
MNGSHLIEQAFALNGAWFIPGLHVWGWRVALVDEVVLLSNPVVFMGFLLFLWRSAKTDPLRVYSFRIAVLSSLPLSSRWRQEVAPEHAVAIEKFRIGLFLFLAAILAVALLKFVYYRFLFVSLHTLR